MRYRAGRPRVARVLGAAALVVGLAGTGLSGTAVVAPSAGAQSTSPSGASSATSSTPSTPSAVTIQVGINDPKDPTIAVLQYMPASVAVPVGGTVDFTWDGTIEPHSVTFLAPGQTLPAPGSDPSLFFPTPAAGAYDGTTFVNSGLQPLGPTAAAPFAMTFSEAGTYKYYCVIHPTMVGTVDVVASGATTTPAAAQAAGRAEQATWLAEGRTAKAKLVASARKAKPTKGSDGSRTWTIQMGRTTAHTDVLAFAPAPKRIAAGDSVTFVNGSGAPHTAKFTGTQEPIANPLDPRTDQAIPGPSPQTLNATDLFNTGELPPNAAEPGQQPPPLAARSFTFTVGTSGKYDYFCILHVSSGMAGTIQAS